LLEEIRIFEAINFQNMKLFRRRQQQQFGKHLTGSIIPLKKVFTDSRGVDWFEYENPLTMPAKRAIAAEVATRFASMNVTKDVLKQVIEQMKQRANAGNIVELFSILGELEFRLDFLGEEETLVELAACYFIEDGENETEFNEVIRKNKVELFKSRPDLFDFFVQRAFEHTINFSNISEADILDYLNRNALQNERLFRFLREAKSGTTLTK
jgi:hypothetical protein